MRRLVFFIVVLAAMVATAQGPFDGTWKTNAQKMQAPEKSDEYKIANGRYVCLTCSPKIDVSADGTDQKVTGSPYIDTENVKVIDDHNIETTEKKNGNVVGTGKFSVDSDKQTLTIKWTFNNANGKSGEGTSVLSRVGAAPKSGNMISGQWRVSSFPSYSDNVGVFSYKVSGDEVAYSAATGENYTAKADGKDYPYKGDPGTTSVVLKKIDNRTLEETDKRNGKVISVTRMVVSADGKTMNFSIDDKLHHQVWKWEAEKQETAAGK
jgi:hypothetical protein